MIDPARLIAKGGNYQFASSGAVTDRVLLDVATQYENTVSRKMTALTPDALDKRYSTDEPVLETTKYDGEGVFVSYEQGRGAFAFNAPSGRVRVGLPALEQLAAHLAAQKVQKALFRAELYLPHIDRAQKRPNIADVVRVSFSGTTAEVAALRLVLLDIIMLDGRDLRPNQEKFQETWDLLGRLAGDDAGEPFHRALGSVIPAKDVARVFAERVAAGHEGLVLRRLQRLEIAKVKPHVSVDAVVIGYVEGEFEGKFGVTSLLTALTYPEKDADGRTLLQVFARVGSGLSDQQREELLGVLAPARVAAPLPMTDSDGRAVHFVRPQHIVELHGEDLVATSSREKENRTQVFSLAGDEFRFLGLVPFPRMTFATFNRMRPDKSMAAGGARIEQVVPNPQKPQIRAPGAREASIVRREVYVKADAVRKLLVVKTGGDDAVPYVIYWSDYSAKRKDPLKVSTECAFTEARAEALAQRLLAEGVTKGFARWTGQPPAAAEPAAAAAEEKPKRPRANKAAE